MTSSNPQPFQNDVQEENVVERIGELAELVNITNDPIDQSQINFNVIVNVLNTTNTIVDNSDFNDTDLTQVHIDA